MMPISPNLKIATWRPIIAVRITSEKPALEQSYESDLHGTTGIEQVEVDAGGRAVRMLSRTPPISGNTLILSIDVKLQEIAEQSFGNYRGALVAIDPNNGEVLAFVSKPGY